ncbi:TPA: hypothetical protein ACV8DY_003391 [Escherichia coli]
MTEGVPGAAQYRLRAQKISQCRVQYGKECAVRATLAGPDPPPPLPQAPLVGPELKRRRTYLPPSR